MQIICKLHCPCIWWSTPPSLYYITWMFSQCRFNRWTAKGNWPASDNSKWYRARAKVGVQARSCCQMNQAGFEQILKFLVNLFIFLMVNTFSWRKAFNDYTTTKWTKFLSCSHLFDFGSPFLSIEWSKLYVNSFHL